MRDVCKHTQEKWDTTFVVHAWTSCSGREPRSFPEGSSLTIELKMISAEHWSNSGENLVTKTTSCHGNIANTEENLSRFELELTQRKKSAVKVIHILIKTNVSR